MQIQNNTQVYNYQNSNQINKSESDNFYLDFLKDIEPKKEDSVFLTKGLIDFINQNDGFLSLSKEDEKLFRSILEDDEISNNELKNLSYEQMSKLNQLFKKLNSETFFIKGFDVFHKANVSSEEDFNKSLFETLKNIDDETQRTLFSLDLKGKLGYNRPRLPFEKSIEEEIAERITFEKEKYKDFPNKDEIMENLIKELKNWKISDYGSFIDKTLFQLKKDISNPNTTQDGKYNLLKNLQYYEDLRKNYNQIQKETQYV